MRAEKKNTKICIWMMEPRPIPAESTEQLHKFLFYYHQHVMRAKHVKINIHTKKAYIWITMWTASNKHIYVEKKTSSNEKLCVHLSNDFRAKKFPAYWLMCTKKSHSLSIFKLWYNSNWKKMVEKKKTLNVSNQQILGA